MGTGGMSRNVWIMSGFLLVIAKKRVNTITCMVCKRLGFENLGVYGAHGDAKCL